MNRLTPTIICTLCAFSILSSSSSAEEEESPLADWHEKLKIQAVKKIEPKIVEAHCIDLAQGELVFKKLPSPWAQSRRNEKTLTIKDPDVKGSIAMLSISIETGSVLPKIEDGFLHSNTLLIDIRNRRRPHANLGTRLLQVHPSKTGGTVFTETRQWKFGSKFLVLELNLYSGDHTPMSLERLAVIQKKLHPQMDRLALDIFKITKTRKPEIEPEKGEEEEDPDPFDF